MHFCLKCEMQCTCQGDIDQVIENETPRECSHECAPEEWASEDDDF